MKVVTDVTVALNAEKIDINTEEMVEMNLETTVEMKVVVKIEVNVKVALSGIKFRITCLEFSED